MITQNIFIVVCLKRGSPPFIFQNVFLRYILYFLIPNRGLSNPDLLYRHTARFSWLSEDTEVAGQIEM